MQQTTNYQLNQWDGEDRIMRVDFNSDNAKIDAALEKNATALSQATSTLEAALETERQARASGDTAANQATASAREELLNAIASEQSARTSGDAAVRGEFAAADASIRKDFAAADAAISSACPIVKLQSIVTSQAATQVDLDMRDSSYRNMAFLILIPQVITSAERVYLRVNSLGEDGYYVDKIDRPYLASFPSCSPSNEVASYTYCRLELYATVIACSCSYVGYSSNLSSTSDTLHSIVKPHIATSQAIQTLNFIAEDGSSISAGSRFTLYGVKL